MYNRVLEHSHKISLGTLLNICVSAVLNHVEQSWGVDFYSVNVDTL